MLPLFFLVMGLVPVLHCNRFQVHQILNTISFYKSLAMQSTTTVNYSFIITDCTIKQNNFQRFNPVKNSSNPDNLHE